MRYIAYTTLLLLLSGCTQEVDNHRHIMEQVDEKTYIERIIVGDTVLTKVWESTGTFGAR